MHGMGIRGKSTKRAGELVLSAVNCPESRMRYDTRFVRLLTALLAFSLSSCHSQQGNKVKLSISETADNLEISLTNDSDQPVVVHEHLVGGARESPIVIEVWDSSEGVMPRCGSLDYFATPREISVAPRGGSAKLLVPVSAVSVTHCLQRGRIYSVRAALVAESGEVQFSRWASFRADMNAAPE